MPFNGSGQFNRIHNWTSDAANSIDINAGEMDAEDNGFATGLSNAVTRDGQGKMAADFTPSVANTFNLGTAALPWLTINGIPISDFVQQTAATVGGVLNPTTAAETAVGVTPVAFQYPAYDIRRYGAVGNGTTDDAPVFNLAGTIGLPIFVPDPPVSWLLNESVTGTFVALDYPKFSGAGTIALRNLRGNDQDALNTFTMALDAGTAGQVSCFGDSTMWGMNPAAPGTQVPLPPPQILQNNVNSFFANTALTVINSGIDGTTMAQMLAGTDGSGSTFASKLQPGGSAYSSSIIFCNHGINDCLQSGSLAQYRANLVAFVRLVRAAGKTPILVTQHPMLTIGTYGNYTVAAGIARFAETMRQVAQSHGVVLVDTNKILRQTLDFDANLEGANPNTALNVLPDGIHGTQATYIITGMQMVGAIIGQQSDHFTRADQVQPCTRGNWRPSYGGYSINPSTTSRYGAYVATAATAPQGIAITFFVDDTGLDISLLHILSVGACAAIGVSLDGNLVGATSFSQYIAGWSNTDFVQDWETCLVRNIAPGFHLIILSSLAGNNGGITYGALRSRQYKKPIQQSGGSATTQPGFYRELLSPKIELQAGTVTSACAFFDTMPIERFVAGITLEFTAQLPYSCGLAIGGIHGGNTGSALAQPMIQIGISGSGFATIWEATGPANTFTDTILDSTDHSTASHTYMVIISTTTIQMFVDGTSVGTATLSQPYYGGHVGLFKNLASTDLVITNVNRIRVNVD